MRWSRKRRPHAVAAARSCSVAVRSAALGSSDPPEWLCATANARSPRDSTERMTSAVGVEPSSRRPSRPRREPEADGSGRRPASAPGAGPAGGGGPLPRRRRPRRRRVSIRPEVRAWAPDRVRPAPGLFCGWWAAVTIYAWSTGLPWRCRTRTVSGPRPGFEVSCGLWRWPRRPPGLGDPDRRRPHRSPRCSRPDMVRVDGHRRLRAGSPRRVNGRRRRRTVESARLPPSSP